MFEGARLAAVRGDTLEAGVGGDLGHVSKHCSRALVHQGPTVVIILQPLGGFAVVCSDVNLPRFSVLKCLH